MIDPGLVTRSNRANRTARQPPPPNPRDRVDQELAEHPIGPTTEVRSDVVPHPQPDPAARRKPTFATMLQRLKAPFEPSSVSVDVPLDVGQASTAESTIESTAESTLALGDSALSPRAPRSPDGADVPGSTRRPSARTRPTTAVRPEPRSLPTSLPEQHSGQLPGQIPGQIPGQPPAPVGPVSFSPNLPMTPAVPAPTRLVPVTPSSLPIQPSALPHYVDFEPEPEPQHQQVPTAPTVTRGVRSTAAVGRRRPRVRRVTRVIRHVDPWSVFKVALCFSVVLYGVCLTAGVLLWNVAYTTGTIDNMQRFFESFGWDTFEFKGGEIYHNVWIGGLFAAIGLTGLIVLGVTLFNLITDLVGGVRVTVLEEEVVERDPLARRAVLGGRRAAPRPIDSYDPDAPLDDYSDLDRDLNHGVDLDGETTHMPFSTDGDVSMLIESTRDLNGNEILPNRG